MFKFHTDHYFHIGAAHLNSGKPCQDYAISETFDECAVAVVSDGCSSGRHTDVGARIVALATMAAMRHTYGKDPFAVSSLRDPLITTPQFQFRLSQQDILATSLAARCSSEGGYILLEGDGIVALKYRDGRISFSKYEWTNNTPFYPTYHGIYLERFIEGQDGLLSQSVSEECVLSNPVEPYEESGTLFHSTAEGINGIQERYSVDDFEDGLEYIALFSDGITQIDNMDWREAVAQCLAFKNVKGEFVKRRMMRVIRDAQKQGRGPIDDIACAVIRIEHDNKED